MAEKKEQAEATAAGMESAPTQTKLAEMVERLEKANKEAKEILAQQQELAAKNLLGGITNAGIQQEKPKEETPREYARRISSGRL